jgi:peptide/nickel transport system permease protein
MTAQATVAREGRGYLRFAKTWSGGIGLALTVSVLFIAIFGPFLAPHPPAALLGPPFQGPDAAFPLGTDVLGRDVLSRVLCGGRTVVGYATIATAIAYLIGGSLGLIAGYTRSLVDPVVMRIMDVMLAFPPFLFLLVLTTGLGTGPYVLIIGVASIHIPGIVRIVRAATLEVKGRGFVEAAVARGERRSAVLRREIVPNITGTLVADAAPRLTISILLVASLNYLGLGLHPPAADWALMLSENRVGLTIQPWSVAVPGLLIVALTIGTNLLADAVARSRGTSIDRELIAR